MLILSRDRVAIGVAALDSFSRQFVVGPHDGDETSVVLCRSWACPNIEVSGSRMAFQTRNELPKIVCETISARTKRLKPDY